MQAHRREDLADCAARLGVDGRSARRVGNSRDPASTDLLSPSDEG
jgi:hypothetical protein